jgi:hypothetical protein
MSNFTVGLLFVAQIALLVLFYGFNIIMPWWLVWLPALFVLFVVVVVLAVIILR